MRNFLTIGVLLGSLELFLSQAQAQNSLPFHGFLEGNLGLRMEENSLTADSFPLRELRGQLEFSHLGPGELRLFLKTDLLLDGLQEELSINLREGYLDLVPLDFLDLRLGRQVLTWGTGDLVFINDLFPKDFVAFFIGRAPQYLKVPSDALRVSLFSEVAFLNLVWIPFFEPDRAPTGERLSFYDPTSGGTVGAGSGLAVDEPARTLENSELALRAQRYVGSKEIALYAFRGFFKQPLGIRDPAARRLFFPRLMAYGVSLRGPFLEGIANLELGYYRSRDDREGADSLIENSSLKYLLGYEREVVRDLTVRFQYFLDQILDFKTLKSSLPSGAPVRDELRHTFFARLTKLLRYQTVRLSLVAFASPSDEDGYFRPEGSYDLSDEFTVTLGGNLFWGSQRGTPFGQFRGNDNLYASLRYTF